MIKCLDIGRRPYLEVLELQTNLHKRRVNGEIGDTLIFCEHDSVLTLGRQDCSLDWISALSQVKADGIDVVQTNRGGRITYHGPGQLVGYLIFDTARFGVKGFVNMVEEVCIKALSNLGVAVTRDPEHPGLWVGDKKIVAVGFHISHNISMHGFALNVSPDLAHYRHIIPCGIKSKGVTSIKEEKGATPPMSHVKSCIRRCFEEVFQETFSTEEKVIGSSSSVNITTESAFFASSGSDLIKSS